MFCRNCGTKIEDGAIFCPECGTQLVQAQAIQAPEEAAPAAQAVQAPEEAAPAVQAAQTPEAAVQAVQAVQPPVEATPQPMPTQKKKKSKKGLVISLCIVFVLLIGVGVGCFLYFRPAAKYDRTIKKAEECMADQLYTEAIDYYQKALEYQQTKEAEKNLKKAYLQKASVLTEEADYVGAINVYETLLEQDKKNKDALKGIVFCNYQLAEKSYSDGDYEQAYEMFSRILEDGDYNEAVRQDTQERIYDCKLEMGKMLEQSEHYEEAYRYYQEVIDSYGATQEQYDKAYELRRSCYLPLGYAAMKDSDTYLASDYFGRALNEDSSCADAYIALAAIQAERGYVDETVSWLEQGIANVTDSAGLEKLTQKKAYCLDHIVILTQTITDDYGNILRENTYDSNGNCTNYRNYDNWGNLMYEGGVTYSENGEMLNRYIYNDDYNSYEEWTYDEHENVTCYRSCENSEWINEITYVCEYDEQGNLIQRTALENGTETVEQYEYDEQGNRINSIMEDMYLGRPCCTYCEYDDQGNRIYLKYMLLDSFLLQNDIKGTDDGCFYYATFTYDEQGKISSEGWTVYTEECEKYGYPLDFNDYFIQYEYYENGNLKCKTEYNEDYRLRWAYDEHGSLISYQYKSELDLEGWQRGITYENSYDILGNLISITEKDINDETYDNTEYYSYTYEFSDDVTADALLN